MEPFRVKDLEDYLAGLSRIFDSVRIVDPVLNKVVRVEGNEEVIEESSCYDFWDKNTQCKNCISRDAAREKETFSKVECTNDEMFLVMSTPIIFEDSEYVVEMIKNMFLIDEVYGQNSDELWEITEVISNLNEKLIRDELTGAYNRRYINRKLPEDIDYALKNQEKLSIIMLDVDCFKEINDIYGHMVGDLALKNLANTIKSNIRKNYDWLARFGGDEFILVLKNSDDKVCNKVIKNIQDSLKEKSIMYNGNKIDVTISLGGYILNNKKKGIAEVLSAADKNLNLAKRGGKNAAVIS